MLKMPRCFDNLAGLCKYTDEVRTGIKMVFVGALVGCIPRLSIVVLLSISIAVSLFYLLCDIFMTPELKEKCRVLIKRCAKSLSIRRASIMKYRDMRTKAIEQAINEFQVSVLAEEKTKLLRLKEQYENLAKNLESERIAYKTWKEAATIKRKELEKVIEKLEIDLEEEKEEVKILNRCLVEETKDNKRLEQELRKLEETNDLVMYRDQLLLERKEMLMKVDNRCNKLETERDEMMVKVAKLEKYSETLEGYLEDEKKKCKKLENERDEMEIELANLEVYTENVDAQLVAFMKVEEKCKKLEAERNGMMVKVVKLEKHSETLEGYLEDEKEKCKKLETERDEMETELANLEVYTKNVDAQLVALMKVEEKCKKLEAERNEMIVKAKIDLENSRDMSEGLMQKEVLKVQEKCEKLSKKLEEASKELGEQNRFIIGYARDVVEESLENKFNGLTVMLNEHLITKGNKMLDNQDALFKLLQDTKVTTEDATVSSDDGWYNVVQEITKN